MYIISNSELKGGYRFAKNPYEIFEKFFLSNNTFAQVFDKELDNEGSLFSHAFGAQNYQKAKATNDLIIDLPCTLVELYNGCSKTVSFSQTVPLIIIQKVNLDGRTTSEVPESRQV
jgi:DnaJ family protein B protein 13